MVHTYQRYMYVHARVKYVYNMHMYVCRMWVLLVLLQLCRVACLCQTLPVYGCVCVCVWTLVGGCQRSVSSLAAQLLLAYVQYVPYICKSACMYVRIVHMYSMYVCLCVFTQKCSIAILFRIKHAVLVWDTQLDFARSTSLLASAAAAFFVCARRQQRQRQRQHCAVLCFVHRANWLCEFFGFRFVSFHSIPFHVACSMPLVLLVSCKILLCLLILIRFFAFAALTTCAR